MPTARQRKLALALNGDRATALIARIWAIANDERESRSRGRYKPTRAESRKKTAKTASARHFFAGYLSRAHTRAPHDRAPIRRRRRRLSRAAVQMAFAWLQCARATNNGHAPSPLADRRTPSAARRPPPDAKRQQSQTHSLRAEAKAEF